MGGNVVKDIFEGETGDAGLDGVVTSSVAGVVTWAGTDFVIGEEIVDRGEEDDATE